MRVRLAVVSALLGLTAVPFAAHAGCTTVAASKATAPSPNAVAIASAFVTCAV